MLNDSKLRKVIVTRHKGARDWLATLLGGRLESHEGRDSLFIPSSTPGGIGERIPILAEAKAVDVHGKLAIGNLPLHLAAAACVVYAIEFSSVPPRGAEYTAEDMVKAGAHLKPYTVSSFTPGTPQALKE